MFMNEDLCVDHFDGTNMIAYILGPKPLERVRSNTRYDTIIYPYVIAYERCVSNNVLKQKLRHSMAVLQRLIRQTESEGSEPR